MSAFLSDIHALFEATIESKWTLWLLIAPCVLLVVSIVRSPRLIIAHILRALMLSLLVLACADFVSSSSQTKQELVALVDVSASVPKAGLEAFSKTLLPFAYALENGSVQVVPFAAGVSTESFEVNNKSSVSSVTNALLSASEKLDRGDTSITKALEASMQSSGASSFLLLSDGYETQGDAKYAASLAKAKGVSIFPLLPEQDAFHERSVKISSFDAPLTVHAGEKAPLRISLKNPLPTKESVLLEVFLGEKKLKSQPVSIEPTKEHLATFETEALQEGLHRVRAVATQNGKIISELHRWVSIKTRTKVLLLSGSEEDESVLKRLLELQGFQLESIVTSSTQATPKSLEKYSSVIFNNIAKAQLASGFLETLKEHISNGQGLLMIGGERSFGLGGYIDSPLEEISPVKFVPPQTKKRRLTKAVVLVIDKSRSMLFQDKIGAAKRAALASVEALQDEDFVGVIGFDSTPFVIIRVDSVANVKPVAERRLRNLTAAGQTNLLPALAAARQGLKSVDASRKHIIILSDGKVPPIGTAYQDEVGVLAQQGVTVSAVALGIEADVPFMQALSKQGGGAFYHTMDPNKLAQIFLHDIKVSTGERTMKEQGEFPVVAGPAGVRSTKVTSFPVLKGFVQTLPKKGSNLELITNADEKLHPILASWDYKKGKVVAFTSDANGRWSSPWLSWGRFASFWKDLAESLKQEQAPKGSDIDFDLKTSVQQKSVVFDLAIFDEKLASQQPPLVIASIVQPGGEVKDVAFVPQRKGRFSARLENGRPGDYRINMTYGAIKLPPVAITLPGDLFGETAGNGINMGLLSELAFSSGGVVAPSVEQIGTTKRTIETKKNLYLPLVLLAFFLLFLEVFVREIGFSAFTSLRRFLLPQRVKSSSGIYQPKKGRA